jgi:hypothetical protein
VESALQEYEGQKMNEKRPTAAGTDVPPVSVEEALSPYKAVVWRELTPRERLRRSWAMRSRLRDPRAVHDRKLFPQP